ncbi:MAG TPA: serine hydrolase domain-containing protein [Gemmatimonadaceae bacterium]|nr:serine hydrolase domain-containing protein [Gemmatimonadaceae bacterium]
MRTPVHVVLLALVALALPMTVRSQQPTPAASAGEQVLRDLVRVMNAGDRQAIRRFVDARFVNEGPGGVPPEQRVERLINLRELFGELAVRSVDASKPREVAGLVQSVRTESWRRMTVFLDEASPVRVLRVGVASAPAPDAPTRRPSDAEIVSQLKGYVERLASRDVFSGTVLLAKRGVPLYQAAVGEANKDFGVRNTLDTKFNLGSMNKMFTAVAVMQLVEAGTLSLDDTLGKFLPAGAMKPDVLAKVRVKHLLTHTSGLGSYFTAEWDRQSRALWRSVDDWMGLVKNESLAFEPGTRWAYSNTGMLVLGKVIEQASGQDYFGYVREHIAKPAGMTNTDSYELDRVNRNLAVGYEREGEDANGPIYRNNLFMHVIRGGPAGGGYSTVGDLTRFAEALKSGKLVSAAGLRTLTTPKPELASPEYGFGFQLLAGGRVVGHGGGFPGINSQLDIYVGEDYTLAVMSNYGDGAEPIAEKVRSLILAGPPPTASR